MRSQIGSLVLCAILLCSGCGRDGDSASTVQQEPDWAQAIQIEGNLYQGLNLDGVGDADDEAYVSMYAFGDIGFRTLAIRVHLGTGETLAEVFPLFDYQAYGFQTGKIFHEDREAIILGVRNLTSNYNATHLWVLEVDPAHKENGNYYNASMWVMLDTTAPSDGMTEDVYVGDSGWGLYGSRFDNSINVARNPEVVDIEGSSLQGLKVTVVSPEGRHKWRENVLYWKDGIWEDETKAYIGKWEWLGEWTLRTELE